MKYILITGWTGYIGSHCVVELQKSWYTPIIIDNLSCSHVKTIEYIQAITWKEVIFYQWDIRDAVFLRDIFFRYTIDAVIHFAWLKAVWESCEKVWWYHDNNIWWSMQLFQIMHDFGVKDIIFSSSATVYKNQDNNISGLKETDLTGDTTNPYGTSKYVIEMLLRDYALHHNWRVINLRYFNPIWAHQSWLIWENPDTIPNNLLPYIMKVASWELKMLQIFGADYDTCDGTWVRDYIDVGDLCIWHVKAFEFLRQQDIAMYEVFNLWVWRWLSVLEIHALCEEITWKNIPYKIVNRRLWDLASVYSDPSKAETMLWWKAKTDIRESIKHAWNFYNRSFL